ncbi:flagellar hook-length control protein FliK [Pseudomonas taetrolens]|uniref:Flagellar hook-length control protein n=1 Tax=Pseudomonas taetrolens TaxID=47884 RepID=A0A0J6GM07_PSETA|nr:flagellar hook-length control protein FliK [Pseudomonas taetrolens]KMM83154.1 flagellar hook-length control protein [Pseudomonas taetrolens]SEC79601.1 flagellar hook-length control protein FliK [Pseudomonas taetrolens]SQF87190.1 flagellar hook-length control protein [Pseudomonas taetrolens]VEH50384.1 flagellar hook-length control protein [Pseudomonas taetrolens]
MPLAAQTLLQTPASAASRSAAANPAPPAAEPVRSGTEHFSRVYAKASEGKSGGVAHKVEVSKDAPADRSPDVADSGKPLPAGKGTAGTDQDADTAASVDEAGVVAPGAVQTPTVPVTDTPPDSVSPQPELQAPQWLAVAVPPPTVTDETFDPEADPLDNLPAVRLAMEQGGHVSASSQASVKPGTPDNAPVAAQGQTSGIAMLVDSQADAATSGEGGEKAFKGLVDDGLKDLANASSDTRVDDFANRLAALTQAAVPKTTHALPVNQPLAMHQSGWSEEVVNRVMYLSSANLKSADIQLEPAELGRLDIRVNISADQAAQVNFVSGHAGVREALDSQMHRLREMFAQQGMGQVDVSVSDQSRQWQGREQEHQEQARRGARPENSHEDELNIAPAQAVAPGIVLGSSAVDYYA